MKHLNMDPQSLAKEHALTEAPDYSERTLAPKPSPCQAKGRLLFPAAAAFQRNKNFLPKVTTWTETLTAIHSWDYLPKVRIAEVPACKYAHPQWQQRKLPLPSNNNPVGPENSFPTPKDPSNAPGVTITLPCHTLSAAPGSHCYTNPRH